MTHRSLAARILGAIGGRILHPPKRRINWMPPRVERNILPSTAMHAPYRGVGSWARAPKKRRR